ncbi:MAG: Uma2 family endonuclease [Prochlorothrix sp.]
MPPALLAPPLTLADFLQQPETTPPQEYINGQTWPKPMPKGKHSLLQTRLVSAINQHALPQRLAHAFTELRCTVGDRSLVPDLSIFTWDRIPLTPAGDIADHFELAPDWTIEILSPDQSQTRVINNILHLLNHGTTLGWLIDPAERTILTFQAQQQPRLHDHPTDPLPTLPSLSPWTLSPGEIFSWLHLSPHPQTP